MVFEYVYMNTGILLYLYFQKDVIKKPGTHPDVTFRAGCTDPFSATVWNGDRLRVGRGTTRAEDAQGTPTQSHISPSKLVYTDKIRSSSLNESEYSARARCIGYVWYSIPLLYSARAGFIVYVQYTKTKYEDSL